MRVVGAAVAAVALIWASQANATVTFMDITFEPDNGQVVGPPDGLLFGWSEAGWLMTDQTPYAPQNNTPDVTGGVLHVHAGDVLTFSRNDTGRYSLVSLDYKGTAPLFRWVAGPTGTQLAPSSDTLQSDLIIPPLVRTFQLYSTEDFELDNVRFADNGGALPEPGTWALSIIGFGLAGSALRRKSKSASSYA
jgi:hypothetical protein